jgi:hypothetical protein
VRQRPGHLLLPLPSRGGVVSTELTFTFPAYSGHNRVKPSPLVARKAATVNSSALLFRYPGNPLISHLLPTKYERRRFCEIVLNFRTM